MPIEIERLFEDYKRGYLYDLDRNHNDLETSFKNEFRKMTARLTDSFMSNRFNARYLEDYINDNLYDLRSSLLKKEIAKIESDFLNIYSLAIREINDISSMKLDSFELGRRLRSVVARFSSSISMPRADFIESYFEEFRNNLGRKYNIFDNYDLRFEVNKIIRNSSDYLMDEYYSTIKRLNSSYVDLLSNKVEEAQRFMIQQNEQLDKIDDVNKNYDPKKPIETNGKTESELREEQRILEDKVMNDPNMSFEEKMDLHKKIVLAYENAINGLNPQLNGQIDIKGKTVKDLEEEKRKAVEKVTNNPNLDIDEVLEELERIGTLYDAAIKAVSPIAITDLKDKTQEELAAEKEEAVRKIMQDTTMSDEQKMELYDRVVAQYDEAIEKSPTKVQKELSALLL